ncbi:MAG: hypothetical protein ACFE7R_03935 [Candidatus Hodarchaeota archaeon]
MKRMWIAVLLAMIVLGTMGYSYASFSGGRAFRITDEENGINCLHRCDPEFIIVKAFDNEIEKDVADIWVRISCSREVIRAYIVNAYPCYEAYVNFTIRNRGIKPAYIDRVVVDNYDRTALDIDMADVVACTWINPFRTTSGQLRIHVLQGAKQHWRYEFRVRIITSCRRRPRPIGFWERQFSTALQTSRHRSGARTIPVILEDYLDNIVVQTDTFSFTGTERQKYKEALETLRPPWSFKRAEAELRAHLFTLWLNYVAGWTEGYQVEGMTAQDIILKTEKVLAYHQTRKYGNCVRLCDTMNNSA